MALYYVSLSASHGIFSEKIYFKKDLSFYGFFLKFGKIKFDFFQKYIFSEKNSMRSTEGYVLKCH